MELDLRPVGLLASGVEGLCEEAREEPDEDSDADMVCGECFCNDCFDVVFVL